MTIPACDKTLIPTVKSTYNYQTCNSTTPYLNLDTWNMTALCSVPTCKAAMNAIANYTECTFADGTSNKVYGCIPVSVCSNLPSVTIVNTDFNR